MGREAVVNFLHKVTLCVTLCSCWHTPGYETARPSSQDDAVIDEAVRAHDEVVGNGSRCSRQRRHVRVAYLDDPELATACRTQPGRVDGCHTTQHGACFPNRCSHVLVVRASLPPERRDRVLVHEAMHWLDECTFGIEYPDNDHKDPLWNRAVELARERL